MRSILGWITYWTSYLTYVAILLMGLSFYSMWAAHGDNSFTPREQLQTFSGTVRRASEVIVQTKRTNSIRDRYYEIEVYRLGAGAHTLHIKKMVRANDSNGSNEWIENLVRKLPEKEVTVLYDNSNEIYEIVSEGQATPLTYEKTRDFLLTTAHNANDMYASVKGWVIYITMLLIGIASSRFRSRYEQE
ncbi:MAG: hypothetical protein LBU53_09545 [Zoogloeaceae bacterium]|jgi:hypothetical protein|nr:hypothetical protein [Zoogloeaceae bacterium]